MQGSIVVRSEWPDLGKATVQGPTEVRSERPDLSKAKQILGYGGPGVLAQAQCVQPQRGAAAPPPPQCRDQLKSYLNGLT